MNIDFRSVDRTRWYDQRVTLNQPNIEYNELEKSLNAPKDIRKISYKETDIHNEENTLKNIEKGSIIPIPGLLIDLEDSNSDVRPPDSDWKAPQGVQWNPMGF